MLPTDAADLMQLFIELFDVERPNEPGPKTDAWASADSLLQHPMAQLTEAPASFFEVFGENRSVLKNLSVRYADSGDVNAATILSRLAQIVDDETLNFDLTTTQAPRFLDLVYPVV